MQEKKGNNLKLSVRMSCIALSFACAAIGAATSFATPTSGMVWDGNDPFHQPFATTNYYGSGDVNNDGTVNASDITSVQAIANGTGAFTMRADVNGDGQVTSADVSLINGAVTGGQVLPAWWDKLTTRQARNNWVDKMLALDATNTHVYNYYYQCVNFAAQLYLHATGCRVPLRTSKYDGGQTVFNIPIYFLNIVGNHSANAILVGDDPLEFSDWRIIEPQNDLAIAPGGHLMPFGSKLYVNSVPCVYLGSGVATETLVEFLISDTGTVSLVSQRPGMALSRTTIPVVTPNNAWDLAMPRLIDDDNGYLLFEALRDDVRSSTDIHASPLPFSAISSASPLVKSSYYSRLLDTCKDSNGTIHMLWSEQTCGTPDSTVNVSIMYGTLDTAAKTITNKSTIAGYAFTTFTGRIVVTGSGIVHAFWIDRSATSNGDLFWSRKNGTTWSAPADLAPDLGFIEKNDHDTLFPHSMISFTDYLFDAVATASDRIVLCWYDVSDNDGVCTLIDRQYDGSSWSADHIILQIDAEPQIRGLDMAADSNGIAHLVYWTGYRDYSDAGRGPLFHRTLSNSAWSSETVVENSANNSCPRLTAYTNGKMFMVWSRLSNGNSIPAWNTYADGSWGNVNLLPVSSGLSASHPAITCITDTNKLAFAWCASSSTVNTIETLEVPINGSVIQTGDVNESGRVDIVDALYIAQYYVGLTPATFNRTVADVNCDASITIVDALLVAQFYVGTIPGLPCP